ncbi:twin-arginine translocation signal domain-containing protein [Halorussus litoreus]|uniref:twin-arginine translocation signal domain-containing protein n=1 Tax=Halorussus litoreus TaxID=1710536 RepID=UPI000E26D938|nr:twin-arginine translocation signal domain-containing protein [Halorussus litoreus]
MSKRSHRRQFLQGLGAVAVSLGVAGCSGSDDSDADPDTDESEGDGTIDSTVTEETASANESESTETETEADGSESADTETEQPEDTPEESQLPTYTFSEGESYTYDTTFGDGESEETWTVTSVDGDDVTVERKTVANGESHTQSISGTHSSIFDEVEKARDINYFPLIRAALIYGQRGDLSAGNTFTVRSTGENEDWETATVDVAGETTVDGVTCTEFTVNPESVDQAQTICLADGYPFAVSLVFEQGGEVLIEMMLTDHER